MGSKANKKSTKGASNRKRPAAPSRKNTAQPQPQTRRDSEESDASSLCYDSDGAASLDHSSRSSKGPESGQKWVQCDKCGKWRRLAGVTDLERLPKTWFCEMNDDPTHNNCSVPEEEDTEDPELKLRTHLRLWVRRLKSASDAETRLPTSHATRGKRRPIFEQEWIQCCDPSCGKWRSLHRSMDRASMHEKHEAWFCVMNSWDEALASCAAPQEAPPAPSWSDTKSTEPEPRPRKVPRR